MSFKRFVDVYQIPKNNYAATTDPAPEDNEEMGWDIGSKWINRTTGMEWVYVADEEGVASWKGSPLSSDPVAESEYIDLPRGNMGRQVPPDVTNINDLILPANHFNRRVVSRPEDANSPIPGLYWVVDHIYVSEYVAVQVATCHHLNGKQRKATRHNNNTGGVWSPWFFENMTFNGPTAQRPPNARVGEQYFDTTLNSPVYWNGTAWIAPMVVREFTDLASAEAAAVTYPNDFVVLVNV